MRTKTLTTLLAILLSVNLLGQATLTLHIVEPGTLPSLISDDQKYNITELTLSGSLNGTDIALIRDMAGERYNVGKLAVIDLSETSIVAGGDPYYYSSYYDNYYRTSDNTIGVYMFYKCANLKSVKLPKEITHINAWAFTSCTELSSVALPNSLKSIGPEAFSGCKLTAIDIPQTVLEIDRSAFSGCRITSVTLPLGISKIAENLFGRCSILKSVTLSPQTTSLGSGAFSGCESLPSITLPQGVYELGSSCFSGCTGLKEIHCLSKTPPTCGSWCFQNIDRENCVIYVPKGCMSAYRNSDYWIDFKNIIEEDGNHTIYYANATCNSGGGIRINNQSTTSLALEAGSSISFSIVPNEGYVIKRVLLNTRDITQEAKNGTYNIKSISENLQLSVTFEEIPTTLLIKHADNGCIKQVVKRGNTYTFGIEPAEGWEIHALLFNGIDVTTELSAGNQYTTLAIDRDSELNIVFQTTGSSIAQQSLNSVRVYPVSDRTIRIENAPAGQRVSVCTLAGNIVRNEIIEQDSTDLDVDPRQVYIVRIGNKAFKVSL